MDRKIEAGEGLLLKAWAPDVLHISTGGRYLEEFKSIKAVVDISS